MVQLNQFARALVGAQDYHSLVNIIGKQISAILPAENLFVWIYDQVNNSLRCESSNLTTLNRRLLREVRVDENELLSHVLATDVPRVLNELNASTHLADIPETPVLRSVLFAPMVERKDVIGLIEAVNIEGSAFTSDDAELVGECAKLVAPAIVARRAQEAMGSGMLRAVTRLTQLYDISRSFNSTIEFFELAPIICNRTISVMDVESCSLWLVNGTQMICYSTAGRYTQDMIGYEETESGTVVGEMLRDDSPLTINDPGDPRVSARLSKLRDSSFRGLICAPVKYEKTWLGALEIVNRRDGNKFTDSDTELLVEISAQAANSIRNAQRHQAERKVKELQALLKTSREITSSLDLDRMLAIVTNQVATLIPFDSCAIALLEKGRYEIDAIAGETKVNLKDPRTRELNDLINWAGNLGVELYISELDNTIDADREETREKLRAHFAASGMKSFYALPLKDEEGSLGVLAMESKTPRFLNSSHLELLKIFSGQATVAIRNAQLYRQVPLIGALEPLAAKKRAFLAMPKARRTAWILGVAFALLFLILFPWNLKVVGNAYVLPTRTATVNSEIDGVVETVKYREGDVVPAGAVVATLRSDEYLLKLNDARSRSDILARELTRVQAATGAAGAQIERVKLEQTQREIAYNQTRLDQTQIRAPINGVVITPKIEEKTGQFIRRGEVFCETADINPVIIEAAIPEDDIGLVRSNQDVWLKANAFPSEKFVGRVTQISPQATTEQGARVFIVRAEVVNPDRVLRTGMIGRVKILTGPRSVGFVLLRDPLRWLEKTVWTWIP